MPKFNVQCKKEFSASYGNAAVNNIEAENASAALLEGARALGFDTNPETQTYTLVLEARPVISLNPPIDMLIDECGFIDAEIKRLTKQKEALSAQIKAEGLGRFSGAIYEGLVYASEGRVSTDWEAIAAKFNPSRQLIAAHTKQGASIVSLKLSKV